MKNPLERKFHATLRTPVGTCHVEIDDGPNLLLSENVTLNAGNFSLNTISLFQEDCRNFIKECDKFRSFVKQPNSQPIKG